MRRGGQADQQHGGPQAGNGGNPDHRQHTQRASQHGELAGGVEAETAIQELRRQPSAGHTADVADHVDHHDGHRHSAQFQAVRFLQEIRDPKQIEPPDGIGHPFGHDECPSLAMRQQAQPGNILGSLWRIALDVLELRAGQAGMIFRLFVDGQPKRQPNESNAAGDDEGPLPTQVRDDPGNQERRGKRAHVRSGVKDSSGEGTLLFRKPFRYGLDAGGENSGFPKPQRRASHHETGQAAGRGMSHRRQAPKSHGQGISQARANAVNQAAHHHHAEGVGDLKRGNQVGVIVLVPVQIGLQGGLEQAQDLTIHVVLGYAEEQQGANHPAITPNHSRRF